ncbi:MAG: hypothetical protein H8D56_08140 [Planctomycetes bacterium]|nr:hypothetical protein [Planctomycetota bacterium]MBL7144285.1 hypothetical protein [Phycisphaerae bacterium]
MPKHVICVAAHPEIMVQRTAQYRKAGLQVYQAPLKHSPNNTLRVDEHNRDTTHQPAIHIHEGGY